MRLMILKRKFVFSILFALCVISLQMAYAEPVFIFKFDSSGNNDLNNPTDLIVDSTGKSIYVVDNKNDRINVFENDGDHDFTYGSFCNIISIENCSNSASGAIERGDGQFNNPTSITRDESGKFFVIDSDNARVQIFDNDGKFQSKFGSSDSGIDGHIGLAKGITVHESSKNILISDVERDAISIFDSSGNFIIDFDSFDGNDKFLNPTKMVMNNDILYVADTGNDRIVIFELIDGTICPNDTIESIDGVCFVETFGSRGTTEGKFDEPSGMAFDSTKDRLYVVDSNNNRVQIFDIVTGNICGGETQEIIDGICFLETFGSKGSTNGRFDTPTGIAFDSTNDMIYIADSDNDRVQAFDVNLTSVTNTSNPPNKLKAYPVSPTSVMITWNEVNDESVITGYKIEYKVGSGDFKTITENTKSTATSFIHQGLDTKDTHFYRIYSINSSSTSDPSSAISVQPKSTTTPTAFIATASSPNQIRLSWLPPSETFGQDISGYEIKREIKEGVYDTIGNTNGKTTTYVVGDLETDKTYSYAVSANIGFGSTSESNVASATPREDSVDTYVTPTSTIQATISTAPIKLTASVVSSTQINLAWNTPVKDGNSPITGYKIEVKRDNGSYTTQVENTKSTARTYSHTNLTTNVMYTYKISAINSIGTSESSNEFSATPKSTSIQISPIGKLTIDEGKFFSFMVKLVDNSVSNMVFNLENIPPIGAKIISSTGMFSWTPSNTDGGKTYTFDVVAKKDGFSDRETITITVNDTINDSESITPPVITPPVTTPTEPPVTESLEIPASFVDATKDPQSYVDRYNNEASYKKWFDDNYSEYSSIYEAVGLEEPKIEEKKFGICGTGTKLIDGVCTIIEKQVAKPWWQFW